MVRTFKLDENTINKKGQTGYEVTDKILEHLKKADSLIEDAYAEINRHEDLAYVQYNSLSSDCTKISDYSRDYKDFKGFTNEYNENVDSIFFKAQEEAMKYLRDVRLEEIELDNNLGIKQMYTSHYPGLEGQEFVKSKINIKDLLECGDVDKALKKEFQQQQLAIKKLKKLAELPKEKWPQGMTDERMEKIRAYVKQLKETKEDQESYDDSIKKLITSGELDYETSGEKITSMVLDCIPIVGDIKGLAEVAIGKDLVSGRRFSDTERAIMLGATIIGFSQVGKVGKVALKLGGKELLKEGAKYTVKETAKNLAMVETIEGMSKLGKNLGLDPKSELAVMAGIVIGGGKLHTKVQNYIKDASKEMKVDSLNSIIKDVEVEGTVGKNLSNIESEVKDLAKDGSNGKIEDEINTASKSSTIETVAKDADDVKNIKDEATGIAKDGVSAESKLDTVSKDAKDNIKNIKDESTGIAKDGVSGESKLDTVSKDAKDNIKNIKDESTGIAKDGLSGESKLDTISKDAKDNMKNIKDESTGIAKDGLSGESKLDTISKDTKELDNVKNEVKDMNADIAISDARKILKDESNGIKVEAIDEAKLASAKAIVKIADTLKTDMNKLFDHVVETVKEGTKIIFTMAETGKKVAIDIADLIKNKVSDAAINFCIIGCFTGDTLVLSKEGQVKIKDIKIGDYVYSQDVRTGEKGFKEVLQLQKRNTCEFVKVKVENEEIQVTPSHLFYTNGQWELAGNLKPGDILTAANGEEKKVIAVEEYLAKEPEGIYNLSVDEYHTYFVGEFGILVHNMGCSKIETAMKEAAEVMPKFTFDDLKSLQKTMKSSINYTSTMFRELMQGVKTGEFGLNVVDDAMREEFKLDGKATYRFDVYKPKLDESGNILKDASDMQISDGSKITVFTDKTGKPVKVIHEVGQDGTAIDRKKVNGYTNADTKPYERGHIFSFQEGLGDNCIEDSPLNIIPQSTPVNSPRISQFEAYRADKCKGKKVITDINIDDPPGYVRVRVPEAGIDVRYNPLATKESTTAWKDDWFMPKNSGKVYD